MSEENSWTENINMLALGCHVQKYEEQIKERRSIRKWINGLNSWLLDNTAVVENDNIPETENPLQNDKIIAAASMMGAWNDTAAVESGWISEMENPSRTRQLKVAEFWFDQSY